MRTALLAGILSLVALGFPAIGARGAESPEIQHRLLLLDESRSQLLYVDQVEPQKSWAISLPEKYRSLQYLGQDQILVNAHDGYREYSLKTHQVSKQWSNPLISGGCCAQRLSNGHTIIGCNQNGLAFYELDAADALVNTVKFPQFKTLRLFSVTPRGTLLFGANENNLVEADLKAKVLRTIPVRDTRHLYMAVEKPDGKILLTTGYGASLVELDSAGGELRRLGGKPGLPGLLMHFFSGFQELKNGHILVCNWTGHAAKDSALAPQLLEFSPEGKILWKWHDPKLAGTIHGILVLDDR